VTSLENAGWSAPGLTFKLARFASVDGLPANQVACAWNVGEFDPPLQGSNVVGHIRFRIPVNAPYSTCYSIKFANADGSPDLNTQYDFESLPGCAWIQMAFPVSGSSISVEWKTNFFAIVNNPRADPAADPDGDGIPNWAEYVAGTDPTNAHSHLDLIGAGSLGDKQSVGFKLRWLSAPGKSYVLECTSDLTGPVWKPIANNMPGSGQVLEFIDTNTDHKAQFYRVRVAP
jgi:hypothetical protein